MAFGIAAVFGVALLFLQFLQPKGAKVVIECGEEKAVSFPLEKDCRLLVRDGQVSEIGEGVSIRDILGEDSDSDANILEIKDGAVSCVESNCSNQICVHSLPLTGEGYELPIICLPHEMVVSVQGATR